MAIHELEPRIKIGPLEIGQRVGREVKGREVVCVTDRFDDSGFRRLLYAARVWRRPSVEQGVDVVIVSANSLRVYDWRDYYSDRYGIHRTNCNLTAQAINLHPIVSKRLHWSP